MNENSGLREQLRMISEDNRAFRDQNGNLLRERDRLKDDNCKFTEITYSGEQVGGFLRVL
jgi:hypothetical protein